MINRASLQRLALFMLFQKFQLFQKIIAVAKLCEIRYTNYNMYVEVERMAEQTGNNKQQARLSEQKRLQNQFILFYTLKELWKLYGNETSGLYKLLFPSNNRAGGNKTKYDNILRLQNVNLLSQSSSLADLTGLIDAYFTGERILFVGQLKQEDWSKFVQLRKKQGTSNSAKSDELKQIEYKIKSEIRRVHIRPDNQTDTLRRLMYFAQYGKKRADKTLQDKFMGIESAINELLPSEFRQADLEVLKAHQERIQKHLQHITAALTMLQWEKEQKGN